MTQQATSSFNWKIAGKAGEGVMAASKILAKAAKRQGLQAFNYLEYPSLIKGGHQTGQVFAHPNQATCQKRHLDLLIAYHLPAFTEHQDEISSKTVVIANISSKSFEGQDLKKLSHAKVIPLPLFKLARESGASQLATNVVSLGVSAYLLGLDKQVLLQLIEEEFASKGAEVIKKNHAAFEVGYNEIAKLSSPLVALQTQPDTSILATGNEAIGMGAIASGLQFYSAYPMTPATALLHYLAEQQSNYPLVVKHVEDEISAINQAIGASYAGVRAMTGSSGGGFALMVEGLSLAGITEIPLVILEAQRTGPASGLPTWTAQADLQFVLTAGHGDFPRVVLTPGTVQEHFELTKQAFYLAEKYQVPVIILSDKFILESHQTIPVPELETTNQRYSLAQTKDLPQDDSYLRYQDTPNGYSPRSIPGQKHGLHLANSYEHDQFGYATEIATDTITQVEKRARKDAGLLSEIPQPQLIGPAKAEVTFVSWGSTVNVLQEVVAQTTQANAIHLPCLWPFPTKQFTKLAGSTKKLVMVEGNQSGQAEKLIRQQTGIEFDHHIRRYDGRPFYSEDILNWIEENT